MNKDRRKQLEDVRDSLDEIISSLNDIKDEEQDAYDNMPESREYESNIFELFHDKMIVSKCYH